MAHHQFVWSDLSTYDMRLARRDYEKLFGWSFQGDDSYDFALRDQTPVAAVFPMPAKLAEMTMPSFWMSYVQVADLRAAVKQATGHDGVIVEIENLPFGEEAQVALVRDPSGAGFTFYEGPDIAPVQVKNSAGNVVERYHHLPDVGLVEAFYADLFGWQCHLVSQSPWPVYDIRDQRGTFIAQIEEVPEPVRGKFRYWIPCFAVDSTRETLATLDDLGGAVSADLQVGRFLVSDQQGAHFMVREI